MVVKGTKKGAKKGLNLGPADGGKGVHERREKMNGHFEFVIKHYKRHLVTITEHCLG